MVPAYIHRTPASDEILRHVPKTDHRGPSLADFYLLMDIHKTKFIFKDKAAIDFVNRAKRY